MDVGNPSNFGRMMDLFDNSWADIKHSISGYGFTDEDTREVMVDVYKKSAYILDPHGAVGIAGWRDYSSEHPGETGIILETAHPAKFLDVVEQTLGRKIEIPEALEKLRSRQKVAGLIAADYEVLKQYLIDQKAGK
jgi:threonine synthase